MMAEGTDPLFNNERTGQRMTLIQGLLVTVLSSSQKASLHDLIGSLFGQGASISLSAASTNLGENDYGNLVINFNGNRAVTLPPPLAGANFSFYTLDGGSGGNLTINVNAGEFILFQDGTNTNTNIVLSSNQRMTIAADGANWIVVASNFKLNGGPVLITSGNVPAASVLTITDIPARFEYLYLQVEGVSIDTNTRQPLLNFSTDNGATYISGAFDYAGANFTIGGGFIPWLSTGVGPFQTANEVAGTTWNLYIYVFLYQGDPTRAMFVAQADITGINTYIAFGVVNKSGLPINALQLFINGTGNFNGGTYELYGMQ